MMDVETAKEHHLLLQENNTSSDRNNLMVSSDMLGHLANFIKESSTAGSNGIGINYTQLQQQLLGRLETTSSPLAALQKIRQRIIFEQTRVDLLYRYIVAGHRQLPKHHYDPMGAQTAALLLETKPEQQQHQQLPSEGIDEPSVQQHSSPSLDSLGKCSNAAKMEEDDNSNSALQCEWGDCVALFDNSSGFVSHVRQHVAQQNRTTKFNCHWRSCKRSQPFTFKYMLVQHVHKHSGEKPYACDYVDEKGTPCRKRYSRLENQKTHKRTHTCERPYVCAVCQRQFTNASDKAKHEKRTHSNIKDFKCPIQDCSKAYTDPSSLRKHVSFEHGPSVWAYIKQIKEENGDYGIIGLDSIKTLPFVIEKHVKPERKRRENQLHR